LILAGWGPYDGAPSQLRDAKERQGREIVQTTGGIVKGPGAEKGKLMAWGRGSARKRVKREAKDWGPRHRKKSEGW